MTQEQEGSGDISKDKEVAVRTPVEQTSPEILPDSEEFISEFE